MLPYKAGSTANRLNIEKHQGCSRMDADFLIVGDTAIGGVPVHPEKPALLAVGKEEFS